MSLVGASRCNGINERRIVALSFHLPHNRMVSGEPFSVRSSKAAYRSA